MKKEIKNKSGILTVKDFYGIFKEVEDFELYVGNSPIYEDELVTNFVNKKITIRGSIYHENEWQREWQRLKQLKADIEDAFNKFLNS